MNYFNLFDGDINETLFIIELFYLSTIPLIKNHVYKVSDIPFILGFLNVG